MYCFMTYINKYELKMKHLLRPKFVFRRVNLAAQQVGHAFFHITAAKQIFTCRSGAVNITPPSLYLQLLHCIIFILISIIHCLYYQGVPNIFSNTAITGALSQYQSGTNQEPAGSDSVLAKCDGILNPLQPADRLKKCPLKGQ